MLDKIERLTAGLSEIGSRYGISASQTAIAWAVAKGTMPLIGATKEKHVVEAAQAQSVILDKDEIEQLESLADQTGVDTRGNWEHGME